MHKIYTKIILLILLLCLNPITLGESSEYQEQLIRVGISSTNFQNLEFTSAKISSDGKITIIDESRNIPILNGMPGSIFKITLNKYGFNILNNEKPILSNIEGPLSITSSNGIIKLPDILRLGKTSGYRNEINIVRKPGSFDKLFIVNVLQLDEYLKGVVPNELPPSFGFEALKAQSVAARNYAIRPREKSYVHFDICDSTMCQVYFGYFTENPISNKAIEETRGLLAIHNNEVITALYSSTNGGCSENYEFAFSDPRTNKFPANPIPYLKSKLDIGNKIDLSIEKNAYKFYTTKPPSFDVNSSYYRWVKSFTKEEFEKILSINFPKFKSDKYFTKTTIPFDKPIGTISNISAINRGLSGKIMELKIDTSKGYFSVKKELNIRKLLAQGGKMLPSANFVIELAKDDSNNIIKITLYGGGFGHGVGMSQYGASYMSKNGYKFDQILQHYYNGTSLGTEPVVLIQENVDKPIRQIFYSPYSTGKLMIDNEGILNIRLKINGRNLNIKELSSSPSFKGIDITSYLIKGKNEVIYFPINEADAEGLSVKMWLELVKAT